MSIHRTAILLLLAFTLHAQAVTFFVSHNGDNSSDGLSWSTAFNSIVEAVGSATSGDQIWVASGTYEAPFTIPEGVSIYGGFSAEENDLDERDSSIYRSIIGSENEFATYSGSGGTSFLVRCEAKTVFDGFFVTNSSFIDEEIDQGFAGVLCADGQAIIRNCVVANVRGFHTAVFEIRDATVHVIRTQVKDNQIEAPFGDYRGHAGVRIINGQAVFDECIISSCCGKES